MSIPVLAVLGVLADGKKVVRGVESVWGRIVRGLEGTPGLPRRAGVEARLLCLVDGQAGLRRALGEVWAGWPVQSCCVHKQRNLERKAPKRVLDELHADFHRIVYAASAGWREVLPC